MHASSSGCGSWSASRQRWAAEEWEASSATSRVRRKIVPRAREPTIRYARMVEQLERKQCVDRERRVKEKRGEQLMSARMDGRSL